VSHLEVREARRSFGAVHAVHGVSLAVERGEFVSLLGPSGSGKTTLLRIVAGFELPDAGTVLLDGRDITRLPPQRRQMGMVFQSYALFPNMTAAENVAFGLRVRRQPAAVVRARVAKLLAMVGLEAEAGRLPGQLSGGQQQRVALARALAPHPEVLLLDEPLSALDARIRVGLRMEIRRIQRELRITTLYVTHDQEEALATSDRVVVFNRGRIEQAGPPRDVYERPASLFVSEFVGTMSRLAGIVDDPARRTVRVEGQTLRVEALPEGAVAGQPVELRVRPERVALQPGGEGLTSPLLGTLQDAVYLGGHTLLRVRVGDQELWVDRAQAAAGAEPVAGGALSVHVPTTVLVTLAPAPGGARDEVAATAARA